MVSESVYGGRYGAIVALHAIPKARTSRVGFTNTATPLTKTPSFTFDE